VIWKLSQIFQATNQRTTTLESASQYGECDSIPFNGEARLDRLTEITKVALTEVRTEASCQVCCFADSDSLIM
jgi:hypothetical protein